MNAIDNLSKSIQTAVAEIKRLRRDNESLKEKAARLERHIETSTAGAEVDAWRGERDQIRQRVEQLADHLESVLGES